MSVNCSIFRVTSAELLMWSQQSDQQKILKNVVFNLLHELCEWVSLKISRKHSLLNVVNNLFCTFDLVNATRFDKRQRILSPVFFNIYRHYVSEIHLPSLWVFSHLVLQLTRKTSLNFPCFRLSVVEVFCLLSVQWWFCAFACQIR